MRRAWNSKNDRTFDGEIQIARPSRVGIPRECRLYYNLLEEFTADSDDTKPRHGEMGYEPPPEFIR